MLRMSAIASPTLRMCLTAWPASAALLLFCNAAAAQNTFLAAGGDDTSTTCSLTAPCLTLSRALATAGINGTITCLDPLVGGPALTIRKAIDINCADNPYTMRGQTSNSSAIQIDFATDDPIRTVRIRGVSIFGGQTIGPRFMPIGIRITGGAGAVFLDKIVISDAGQVGIIDQRTGGQSRLYIADSVIRNNTGPGIVAAGAATAITVLENVSLLNNTFGLAAATGNNVVINRSVMSGNSQAGVEADPGAKVNVSNSVISHNNFGVQAFGTVRLRENDIAFSNTAVQGNAISMGANRFSGNSAIGTTPTLATGASADVFN